MPMSSAKYNDIRIHNIKKNLSHDQNIISEQLASSFSLIVIASSGVGGFLLPGILKGSNQSSSLSFNQSFVSAKQA